MAVLYLKNNKLEGINMEESVLAKRAALRISRAPRGEREELLSIAAGMNNLTRLGRGDPDLETPAVIVNAAVKALKNGCTHYTHWAGLLELRTAIAEKLLKDNELEYDPNSEVVVTTGGQEAMNVIFQGLITPGDEVIIADPFYTPYKSVVELAGGRMVYVPTYEKDDFVLQTELIRERITDKTKVLVVVTPNNPTGSVIQRETLQQIAELAVAEDLLVVSDEIYEKLIYDGLEHVSIATFPGMHERTIVLNGFSKTYSMTGWRIGYIAAPADFIDRIQMIKYNMTISVNHVAQIGAIAALSPEGQTTIQETHSIYAKRRRLLMEALNEMGLTYSYPGGTFYVFVNITPTGKTAFEFCRDLLHDAKIQIFPGTTYGQQGKRFVRISLLAPLKQLRLATERMGEAVSSYIAKKEVR
jgi:aminotransferase